MKKEKSGEHYKEVKIHIKNADVYVASGITHQMYEMVDVQELYSISIDDVRKSKNSVDVIIGVIIGFSVNYFVEKAADIPYNYTVEKIRSILKKWKKKTPQKTLDIFMDDEQI